MIQTRLKTVAIIGIGNMGGAMAQCLLRKAYNVYVVDIDNNKTAALAKLGAIVIESPAQIPHSCTALIVCVVDSAQVASVLSLMPQPADQNGCVILCPTIAPQDTEVFCQSLTLLGYQVIDAPMSGGPQRALEGTMSLMVACTNSLFLEHQALLQDLSSQVFHVSEQVGDGARMKLCNNLLAGINLAGAAEVLALAERMGLEACKALAIMQSSSGQSWIAQDRMSRALDGDFAPRAHMTLLAKDTQLALAMAAKAGVTCSVGIPASNAFADAASQGYADSDDAALLPYFRHRFKA